MMDVKESPAPEAAFRANLVAHASLTDGNETPNTDLLRRVGHTARSYRNIQWSADGTCLIGTNYEGAIQTYIVPTDLLEPREEPHSLTAYCSISSAEPVSAVAGVPFFDLQTPTTALVLSSLRDHPLRLTSALTGERVASYSLINPMTEAYICPNALTFNLDGRHIIAGSESLLSVFDISCSGQEPLHSIQTGPKKLKDDRWNPSTSIRGVISTLAIEPGSNLLAAGTFSRQIGLYEAGGVGECVGAFSIAGNTADVDIGGGGITQVAWSPCGRYLYVAERKSDGVMLYDIRKTGQLLSWCTGRGAMTSQRLAFDLVAPGSDSQEIWAGGSDGIVRLLKDLHHHEGGVAPSWDFAAHTGRFHHFDRGSTNQAAEPVSGVAFHRSGGVLATSSGQDYFKGTSLTEDNVDAADAGIKIWTVDST